MHLTSLIRSAVLLALVVPPATVTPVVENARYFLDTCYDITFDGYGLEANCVSMVNKFVNAYLDLDRCIKNINGNLACAPVLNRGGYTASCSGCQVQVSESTVILGCQCYKSGRAILQYTQYDISECILRSFEYPLNKMLVV
ncbi:hypothetical protein FB451DRAFT_1401368 [Mycena latifolia]|nr:hypothetical protein FB451DRAFT_1401368 [Mycena latifolia]